MVDVDRDGLTVKDSDGTTRRIESACKVWSAGVSASPLGKQIAEQAGVEIDRAGRVVVLPDLTVAGHPNVFVIGDMASVPGVPGMAQGAIQGGRYAARAIVAGLDSANPDPRVPFRYFDKGSMATVSRFSAVVKVGRFESSGLLAWLVSCGADRPCGVRDDLPEPRVMPCVRRCTCRRRRRFHARRSTRVGKRHGILSAAI